MDLNLDILRYKPREGIKMNIYPEASPTREYRIGVHKESSLPVFEYGNPDGVPLLMLHGGPGAGYSPFEVRCYNPKRYRIIAFNQRGAAGTKNVGETTSNTLWDSVDDIESIRRELKVEKWVLSGGSYGSTLALAYAEKHPERCVGILLRGPFLARTSDIFNVIEGLRHFRPEEWQLMLSSFPECASDLSSWWKAFESKTYSGQLEIARLFMDYDLSAAFVNSESSAKALILANDDVCLGVTRLFFHYARHQFWLEENQLLRDLPKIDHIPGIIVQGRFDLICRPEGGWLLANNWQSARLDMVENGGHSIAEAPMAEALRNASDELLASYF